MSIQALEVLVFPMANSLLSDPILPLDVAEALSVLAALPKVLACLATGKVTGFPGLASHQRQGRYQFLVQLGAIALNRAALDEPPTEEAAWRDLLLALAPEPAWHLVVEDPREPAFLQPPVRDGNLKAFNRLADTPDGIDVLITAK